MRIFPTVRQRAAVLALATTGAMPTLALACELDGLSHGYGPMSALFAGAHQYQALNGLVEDDKPSPEPPPAPSAEPGNLPPRDGHAPSSSGASPSTPPTPRRSFAAWAKAKPKPTNGTSASERSPPAWAQGPLPARRSNAVTSEPER